MIAADASCFAWSSSAADADANVAFDEPPTVSSVTARCVAQMTAPGTLAIHAAGTAATATFAASKGASSAASSRSPHLVNWYVCASACRSHRRASDGVRWHEWKDVPRVGGVAPKCSQSDARWS